MKVLIIPTLLLISLSCFSQVDSVELELRKEIERLKSQLKQSEIETKDLDGEWDGSLNQIPLPQDSYLYEITYEAESGIFRTSRGKVAMLR